MRRWLFPDDTDRLESGVWSVSALKMFSMRHFIARLCCTGLLLERSDGAELCTVTALHGSAF